MRLKLKISVTGEAHPATWPSTNHDRQSSTMEKLRDLIHACVPTNGTLMSWSPLRARRRVNASHKPCMMPTAARASPVCQSSVSSAGEGEMILQRTRHIVRVVDAVIAPHPDLLGSLLAIGMKTFRIQPCSYGTSS